DAGRGADDQVQGTNRLGVVAEAEGTRAIDLDGDSIRNLVARPQGQGSRGSTRDIGTDEDIAVDGIEPGRLAEKQGTGQDPGVAEVGLAENPRELQRAATLLGDIDGVREGTGERQGRAGRHVDEDRAVRNYREAPEHREQVCRGADQRYVAGPGVVA